MKFSVLISVFVFFGFQTLKAQEILCAKNQGTSDYYISWSVPAAPCGPFVSYEIWASANPLTAFSLISTITNPLQTDFVHLNGISVAEPIYYYIIYNYNCPGQPPVISQTVTSDFGSYEPEITSLNATASGIEICWNQSTFPQTAAYVVSYLLPNGLAFPLDTVFGITTTCYLDVISNLNDPDLVYTLSYLDGCASPSQFNEIGYQLMQVQSEQQGCNQLIEYEWENYNNPYDLDFSYNIYIQLNNGSIDLVSNQAGNQNIFNFFNFIDEDIIAMRVEVIDENGVARSNSPWLIDTAMIVQPPRAFYIYYLSVFDDNQIDINYFIDSIAELRNMEIDTSQYGIDFDWIARYDRNLFSSLGYIYLPDTVSPPYNYARYYQIIANDSCNTNHYSTIGRTIYVEAFLNDFFKNEVTWNAFELEDANVTGYKLYRDYGAGLQYIETFAAGSANYEYLDDVSDFYNQEGTFCYRVEADYSFQFPDGSFEAFTSSSNIGCVEQRPSVYIPNAIAPNGINNEFKPFIVFGNPTNYKMQIFNRWGELIFEGNDPNSGWFGTKNGSEVPTGGYPYVITFTASDGVLIEKKGIVTVVR